MRQIHRSALSGVFAFALVLPGVLGAQDQTSSAPKLHGRFAVKPAPAESAFAAARSNSPNNLPLWTYFTESTRDGNAYTGVMVGQDPFNGGGTSNVPTYVIPLVIQTNTIGTKVSSSGIISTTKGITVFDPTAVDRGCMSAPNNVPLTVFRQSPIIQPALFDFGGTIVGTTQYVDAFQRANFWNVDDHSSYHVLLKPVTVLDAITVNVPAAYGTTLPQANVPSCGPLGIVDINWFDTYITSTVLPALASKGIKPSTFPLLLVHDVVWASPVTNLNDCCILGYHGATGLPLQTYSPADFDTTGLFGSGIQDTAILSHEIGEWMNDPFGDNMTPPWGNTGQVAGCQGNLEVGDPLTGTLAPPIVMPNGYTYHLQELAFFSWFFGTPPTGIHNWFSDNSTFLHDAGPVCQSASSASSSATNWWDAR